MQPKIALLAMVAACGGQHLSPTVTVEPCTDPSSCSPGRLCTGVGCMPEASAGEPCDSLTEGALLDSNCTPGLICLPEGVCGSPLALGDSCWADYPCATGICREGRCAAPGARRLGDTCTEEGDCGPDLTCDQICYEALPSGSGCVGPGAWEACADGLGCWRGRCAAP